MRPFVSTVDEARAPTLSIIDVVDHRPYPLPAGPWVMGMVWYKLLFAHWRCPPAALRPHVPASLELDTYEGDAYLGVVPFGMSQVSPPMVPPLPWLSKFLELNVRTYVKADGKSGVYFFSLDAANPVAVACARRFFMLPYYNALMSMGQDDDWVRYRSRRTHRGAGTAEFGGRYRPTGERFRSQPRSIEEWLTERYCLFTTRPSGRVFRCDIHHLPWPLQKAEADIESNSMIVGNGLPAAGDALHPHLLHYAAKIDTVAWPLAAI